MRFEPMPIVATRGRNPESFHSVDVVVSTVEGPVKVWGDAARSIMPRSAVKHLQAIPLVRTGAAEAFGVTDEELALACASHSAEGAHLEAVASWLHRVGFEAEDLECGLDLPLDEQTRTAWLHAGRGPALLANCCSGKHAGFLTIARHQGWDPSGYVRAEHGVQLLVTEALEQFCDVDLTGRRSAGSSSAAADHGIDGCGIPTWMIPLERVARGMARLVRPDGFDQPTAVAARRIVTAVTSRHFWVAGTGRVETRLADGLDEPGLFKSGAEGVFTAALPDRGLGIAVKARDGADRAARVAMAATLIELGVLTGGAATELAAVPLHNKAGQQVGELRCAR